MAMQEEINKIEERAQELLANLEKLHQEVGSYKAAKDELQKTSVQLLNLIENTQGLSQQSHKIIEKINQIGSGKIFERLENIEKINQIGSGKIFERLENIEKINQIGSGKIFERLENIENTSKKYFFISIGAIVLIIVLQGAFFFWNN